MAWKSGDCLRGWNMRTDGGKRRPIMRSFKHLGKRTPRKLLPLISSVQYLIGPAEGWLHDSMANVWDTSLKNVQLLLCMNKNAMKDLGGLEVMLHIRIINIGTGCRQLPASAALTPQKKSPYPLDTHWVRSKACSLNYWEPTCFVFCQMSINFFKNSSWYFKK